MTEIPREFLQLMTREWRAQPEDTMGGWCVTLAEDPRSPSQGALAIAAFLSREVARHIAEIHNSSLVAGASASHGPAAEPPAAEPPPARTAAGSTRRSLSR